MQEKEKSVGSKEKVVVLKKKALNKDDLLVKNAPSLNQTSYNLAAFKASGGIVANPDSECQFCGLSFQGMKASQAAPHVVWCDKNPNKAKNIENIKKARNSVSVRGSLSNELSGEKICKHCGERFSSGTRSEFANHTRWCLLNPKRNDYNTGPLGGSRVDHLNTPEAKEKRRLSLRLAHENDVNGNYKRSHAKTLKTKIKNGTLKPSEKTKQKISASALASKHQRVCKSTHDFIDKKGRRFRFDSSWEDAVAIRLDELDIEWDRPAPIAYNIEGKNRNYFADFYLPHYNLYVDPKNPYCLQEQREKLELIKNRIKLAVIPSLKDCQTFDPADAERFILK